MVVFGKGAKEFVECEKTVDSPVSPNGCYAELYKRNGFILLIGVGQEKDTFIHWVEEILQIKNRISDRYEKTKIIHPDGREEIRDIKVFLEDGVPDASNFFGKFEKAFRHHGCIEDGVFGRAKVQLCNAIKIKEVIELIYSRNDGSELLGDFSPLEERLYK
jgi:aminoglycoside 3-N-acetyltransferase